MSPTWQRNRAGRQGLPLCRLYARFWGGDITLMSMENWGCSFLIRLPKKRTAGKMIKVNKGDHYQTLSGNYQTLGGKSGQAGLSSKLIYPTGAVQ